MKKNYKSILILVTLFLLFCLSILKSTIVIQNILDYSILFLTKLFPVSFLLFILSNMLIEYGFVEMIQLFLPINMSRVYVYIISLLSGFPSGVICVSDLYRKGNITQEEANQMLLFCHFPNPLFLFGTVSTVIGESNLTLVLFFSIFISNTLLFFRCNTTKKNIDTQIPHPGNFSQVLGQSIRKAFELLEVIYGTSLFFYLIAFFILSTCQFSSYFYVFIYGIFDLTKGVFATSVLSNSLFRCFFILFFIQFGPLSIHMQVKGILPNSLSYSSYLKGRVISTIVSFILFFLFLKIPI